MKERYDFQGYIRRQKSPEAAKGVSQFEDYAFDEDMQRLRLLNGQRMIREFLLWSDRFWQMRGRRVLLNGCQRIEEGDVKIYGVWKEALGRFRHRQVELYRSDGQRDPMLLLGDSGSEVIVMRGNLELLSEERLLFWMGHALGGVMNGHARYSMLHRLYQVYSGRLLGHFIVKHLLSLGERLSQWEINANVTRDRAGLLCCKDFEVSVGALLSGELGWGDLEIEKELGRYRVGKSVDWEEEGISKRIASLRCFLGSEMGAGLGGGGYEKSVKSLTDVDLLVRKVLE